ncbi:aldehyde dehydrogenase family protein [Rhodococcus wratislaviensis]
MVSPSSEDLVARVPRGNEEDVDCAVTAAREAFDRGPWPRTTPE